MLFAWCWPLAVARVILVYNTCHTPECILIDPKYYRAVGCLLYPLVFIRNLIVHVSLLHLAILLLLLLVFLLILGFPRFLVLIGLGIHDPTVLLLVLPLPRGG